MIGLALAVVCCCPIPDPVTTTTAAPTTSVTAASTTTAPARVVDVHPTTTTTAPAAASSTTTTGVAPLGRGELPATGGWGGLVVVAGVALTVGGVGVAAGREKLRTPGPDDLRSPISSLSVAKG